MARNRASMREGPLAELFRATEAAQRGNQPPEPPASQPPARREPRAPETNVVAMTPPPAPAPAVGA